MLNVLISFFLSLMTLVLLLKTPLSDLALDKPNERSLHVHHTPRTGGLAIMVGVIITWFFGHIDYVWILAVSVLISISLLDDICGLSVRWRLLVQLIVTGIFVWIKLPDVAWWMAPVITLGLVWMTNLYNFMDGSDGLAGGMGMIGFTFLSIGSMLGGDMHLAMMCACAASSCLAFLVYNFHPAKIFMGDSGSIPLGFLAGAIGLYGVEKGLWQVWFPLLIFSPFIVDATVTLIKRLLRGEKPWQAHREHYYQRLVQMGWGHENTALAGYALMAWVGVSALFLLQTSPNTRIFVLIGWVAVYFFLMRLIDLNWKIAVNNKRITQYG